MNTPSMPSTAAIASSVAQRDARFQLHQHADFLLRVMQIIRHAAEAVGAVRHRHAADAMRRIAGRGNRGARLIGRLHERHQQAARADIQQPLHQHRVVPGHPHHRLGGAGGQRLQLGQHLQRFARRMFSIDDDPVVAGIGQHLGDDIAAQAAPQADLAALLAQRGFS